MATPRFIHRFTQVDFFGNSFLFTPPKPIPLAHSIPYRNFAFLASYFVFLLSFSSPLLGDSISGKVINKTLNQSVSDAVVTLVRHGSENVDVYRDTTGSSGEFQFSLPDVSEELPLLLSTFYAGVDHHNHEVKPGSGPIELAVYETTEADSAIAIISHHILVDAREKTITQILVVENRGNHTFKKGSGHGHGLEITMVGSNPQVIQGPENMHTHGGTIIDARPLEPGNSQLVFAISTPPDGKLIQEIGYPTGSFDLLIMPADTLVAANLPDLGRVTFGEQIFHRFTGTELKPGDRVDFQIQSPSVAVVSTVSDNGLPWILGSVALIFAVLALYYRPGKRASSGSMQAASDSDLRRKVLLSQIADLDDRYESGKLQESDHRLRRDALKAEVTDLTRSIDRELLLHQIVDLDDRFENGDLKEKDYKVRRDALKAQVIDLSTSTNATGA